MNRQELRKILDEILEIDRSNIFLKYIVDRVQRNDYRGWHVSQHNRYDLDVISLILKKIYSVVNDDYFAIPPGDYHSSDRLGEDYRAYQTIVDKIKGDMGRGTLNSVKKNFFPDLKRMGFLEIVQINNHRKGKLTESAVNMVSTDKLIVRYKMFTDGVDKLFGNKISDLAERIYLSDYATEMISIYEFMFIFSDDIDSNKIGLVKSYRGLEKYKREKAINLVQTYANPDNFDGDKSEKRDFHNWKNQAQQILNLLKTTVYFMADPNIGFRLNIGNEGFFQEPGKRKEAPKREYFRFHNVSKQEKFELHHVVPISVARNKEEAKLIDDYRNLMYLHESKHKEISLDGNKKIVLDIDKNEAKFSDIDANRSIIAHNGREAMYSKEQRKITDIADYNIELLAAIYEYSADP